jgi:hypothetical protein
MIVERDKDYNLLVNGIKINDKIFTDELCDYILRERDDQIDNLIDWIGEAKDNDKQLMKDDLKYLIDLNDTYIFSSISTNEYIAESDNKERFNEICEEILKLNNELNKGVKQ